MNIKIYTGYDKYFPRGTLTISYDRISHINLYMPRSFAVHWTIEREAQYEWCARTGEEFKTHNIFNREVDYKFTIKKLSKAEIPYRKGGMTHQVLSNDLMNYIEKSYLYTKLTRWESLSIKYNLNRFVWQTKEFKKHIYFHIGTNIVSAILGIIGTLLVVKGCDKGNTQSDSLNTSKLGDSIKAANQEKHENKIGGVDSTAQYSLTKDGDSLQNAKLKDTTK